MRLSSLLLPALALFTGSVQAQYFSEGWKPGQAIPSVSTVSTTLAIPTSTPAATAPARTKRLSEHLRDLSKYLDVNEILTLEPVANIFSGFGVNITERVERVRAELAGLWNLDIPLITDENYGDMIVNETLTEEEERERVWFLIITVTAAKTGGVSQFVDQAFDAAYNLTQEKNDLPHVRWGRIDYLNVTSLTTKWSVWTAPYLVVLSDRGQTLRFFRASQIRLTDELLHDFLKEKRYLIQPPWTSAYGPGGSREWVMDYLARALTVIYDATVMVPKWMLYVGTGAIGSFLISIMHSGRNNAPAPRASSAAVPPPPAAAAAPAAAPAEKVEAASPSSSSTPKKKGKKKGGK